MPQSTPKREPDMPEIGLAIGDITIQDVDAVVNAANSSLMGGGGVDGAIHRAGGASIKQECHQIRSARFPNGLPAGSAVATGGGDLRAKWVIHTVGPVFAQREDRSHLLASCHRESLRVADEIGARTVAFPAISTGIYGYPVEQAAPVAIRTVADHQGSVTVVTFVLFDQATYDEFEKALNDIEK
jgi:O-acetyl-ADP-ribose deacetylase (regulator of RNase III)